MTPDEFHYRVSWRSDRAAPGAHRSTHSGGGQLFQRHLPFFSYPDPRRLDLRASLMDPLQSYRVRVCDQRSSINVFAIADLSASMDFRGRYDKFREVTTFFSCLANSAHRNGDRLGILALSDRVVPEFYLPPTRHGGELREFIRRLRAIRPQGGSARGLLDAARHIPQGRSLVFLLSDFHYSVSLLRRLMISLSQHQVVPVIFWDDEELEPHRSGLGFLRDLESGAERLMWLRPELRKRLESSFRQRRERLVQIFRSFSSEPLFMVGEFDPRLVTAYFAARP